MHDPRRLPNRDFLNQFDQALPFSGRPLPVTSLRGETEPTHDISRKIWSGGLEEFVGILVIGKPRVTYSFVLAQREMEKRRSPLGRFPPLRGGDF